MLRLVHPPTSTPSSRLTTVDATSLTADYLAFERRRTSRRQYMKAFGGMAVIVLIGAAFGRVPAGEAWIVAGLLALLPLLLAAIEAAQWRRLVRRLDGIRRRGPVHAKVVKKS